MEIKKKQVVIAVALLSVIGLVWWKPWKKKGAATGAADDSGSGGGGGGGESSRTAGDRDTSFGNQYGIPIRYVPISSFGYQPPITVINVPGTRTPTGGSTPPPMNVIPGGVPPKDSSVIPTTRGADGVSEYYHITGNVGKYSPYRNAEGNNVETATDGFH